MDDVLTRNAELYNGLGQVSAQNTAMMIGGQVAMMQNQTQSNLMGMQFDSIRAASNDVNSRSSDLTSDTMQIRGQITQKVSANAGLN